MRKYRFIKNNFCLVLLALLVRLFFDGSDVSLKEVYFNNTEVTTITKLDKCSLGLCHHHNGHFSRAKKVYKIVYHFSPYVLPNYIKKIKSFSNGVQNVSFAIETFFSSKSILSKTYRGPPSL